MPTFVRLTDYKSSDEKEKGFFEKKNRFVANQEDFFKIPGNPIAYWVSDDFINAFISSSNIDNFANIIGSHNKTANNDKYIRYWWEIQYNTLFAKWVGYAKGGEFRKWFGNTEYIVDWSDTARKFYETNPTSNLINEKYWFREGITYTDLTTRGFNCRYIDNKSISDMSGPAIYIDEKINRNYIMGLLNSIYSNNVFKILNPTFHIKINDIKRLPIIFPKFPETKQKIDQLTQECIDISKEEWDSRETSWDFRINELIRVKNENLPNKPGVKSIKLEDVYNAYCEYWREKFYKLHKNEEELNKLFIEIYGLEDELTPDVPLEDITILKKEAKIVDGELVFDKKEIIKQFISYFVGVLFGRFSLDKERLVLANLGEGIEEYLKQIPNPSFLPDDDNVVPVLEREYFEDDIVSRFKEFMKIVFGEKYYAENMRFIENAIGDIRKYFNKEFYKDHIQRYKKRPIYWMITSKNGAFKALIYMHRFKPDIFARVRNEYLLELIAKIESRIESLDKRLSGADSKEKKQIEKELVKLNKELKELYDFDKVLQKYANKTFEIDLDDGVKVNYCKFKEILYPISNLCK